MEKLARRHPMVFFCSFQSCSLFFKKYNTSLQVWPAALPVHLAMWPCGSCCPQRVQAVEGSHSTVDSPCSLCCWHGQPWTLCWAVAWADQGWPVPTLTSSCGLTPVPCSALPAEAAASGSISTQQMTEKKEEIYLSSVNRDPVFLWVWGSALSPKSVAQPPPVHGSAGGAARGGARGLCVFWCRMENGLAADLTTSALSQRLVPHSNGCEPFGPALRWGYHTQTGMNCASVRIFFGTYQLSK